VFEGKYELDSHGWFLKLSSDYINSTADDSLCLEPIWKAALAELLAVVRYQPGATWSMSPSDEDFYYFTRETTTITETLMVGIGVPGSHNGMSKSPFRPSDDSHLLPYPVAANAFVTVGLTNLARLMSLNQSSPCYDPSLAKSFLSLAADMKKGISTWGIVPHRIFGNIFAYEVDAQGSHTNMDDAGIPGLLSLPYFGFLSASDPVYVNTRRFLLSSLNPYFFNGSAGQAIGGPHNGYGWVWPMSIMTRAFTSADDKEILAQLEMLKSTHNGTYFMHESFWLNDAGLYTRSWFAWANSLYAELILYLARTRPHLIF